MLDKYGDEEDKMAKMNLWNYFEVFGKLNEKSIKIHKNQKVRSTDITMTNVPTIEMDDETTKQMAIFEDLITKFT